MQIFSKSSVNLQWTEKSEAKRFGGAEHVRANRQLGSSFFNLSAAADKEQQRRTASAFIAGQSAHGSSLTFARHTGNVSTWNRVLRENTASPSLPPPPPIEGETERMVLRKVIVTSTQLGTGVAL